MGALYRSLRARTSPQGFVTAGHDRRVMVELCLWQSACIGVSTTTSNMIHLRARCGPAEGSGIGSSNYQSGVKGNCLVR